MALVACDSDDMPQTPNTDEKEWNKDASNGEQENQEYNDNTENIEENGNAENNSENSDKDNEGVPEHDCGDPTPVIAGHFAVSGRITDINGNPITAHSLSIMTDKSGMVYFTNEKGEYEVSFDYEKGGTSPWEYGTPTIVVTYEERGYPQVGYIPQTITYEFTKEHRVEETDLDEEYLIDDADVVLLCK